VTGANFDFEVEGIALEAIKKPPWLGQGGFFEKR